MRMENYLKFSLGAYGHYVPGYCPWWESASSDSIWWCARCLHFRDISDIRMHVIASTVYDCRCLALDAIGTHIPARHYSDRTRSTEPWVEMEKQFHFITIVKAIELSIWRTHFFDFSLLQQFLWSWFGGWRLHHVDSDILLLIRSSAEIMRLCIPVVRYTIRSQRLATLVWCSIVGYKFRAQRLFSTGFFSLRFRATNRKHRRKLIMIFIHMLWIAVLNSVESVSFLP